MQAAKAPPPPPRRFLPPIGEGATAALEGIETGTLICETRSMPPSVMGPGGGTACGAAEVPATAAAAAAGPGPRRIELTGTVGSCGCGICKEWRFSLFRSVMVVDVRWYLVDSGGRRRRRRRRGDGVQVDALRVVVDRLAGRRRRALEQPLDLQQLRSAEEVLQFVLRYRHLPGVYESGGRATKSKLFKSAKIILQY